MRVPALRMSDPNVSVEEEALGGSRGIGTDATQARLIAAKSLTGHAREL